MTKSERCLLILTEIRDNEDSLYKGKELGWDTSLFGCWDKIPKDIQDDFISYVENYLQETFESSANGWADGWNKESRTYIDWLKDGVTERRSP
jgi:hypothetical protein